MVSQMEIIIRLVLAAAIGGIIGIERELKNRPAGLRTHVLVSLGSALIMLISIDGFNNTGDPGRLAAQVVSGVGFLGAGTIMRNENGINGLTTAASLWVAAGIGLAVGTGYYLGSIITASIALITLMKLGNFEKKIMIKNYTVFKVVASDKPGTIGKIGTTIGYHKISIKDIAIENDDENNNVNVKIVVKTAPSFEIKKLYKDIYDIDGVVSVSSD